MRVLALADRPFHADLGAGSRASTTSTPILTLGDLQPSWIEPLERVRLPKLGVYGNHDDEPYMDVVRDRRPAPAPARSRPRPVVRRLRGLRGLPPRRVGRVGPSFSQKEARKLARKLPAADVLVCHCPPRGVNDDPDDPAHIGFEALRDWVTSTGPRWLLHGHVHPMPGRLVDRVGDTRVVFVSGIRLLELT